MMEKLIITAAICGAEVTKENSPAIPYTVEEMVREAKSAYDAGAAVIHVHVRWDDGTPTQDRERFRVVLEAIKAACPGVILIPSTGGATGMTPEERLQPTELFPEMATLDCGTCIQFIVIHHFLAAVDQKIIIKPCSRWQTDECTFFDPVFCDIWEIDFFYRCGGSNTDDVTVFYGLFHRITYDDLLNLRTFLLYELFKCMQGTLSSSFHFYRSNLRADA